MRFDDSDLLRALHEGMFEQPLWHGFLERFRQRSGALSASLIFRPVDEDKIVELHAGQEAPRYWQSLFTEKYQRDPLSYTEMREGRVYSLEELIDPSDQAQQRVREDWLQLWGVSNIRSVRVAEPSGTDAWLICAGGRNIGSSTGALIAMLAPHLRVALRSYITLERERFRSEVNSRAFSRLNFGWLTLDLGCRIIDMTTYVEQLFQRTSILRRGRYDRLTPASPTIDREMHMLVKRFAADSDSRPKAINLSRDPWIDMLVSPIQHRDMSAASKAVAIVYISGDRWSQADRCEQLVDLFGLLPSEARLAWSIAQGMSIAEAAADLGLTIETARNYSKKIYAKTGARGQAELVRNIFTSVLALA